MKWHIWFGFGNTIQVKIFSKILVLTSSSDQNVEKIKSPYQNYNVTKRNYYDVTANLTILMLQEVKLLIVKIYTRTKSKAFVNQFARAK